MFTSTRKTRIEWGDCDPAGIIFFARYFDIFDVSTTVLIERALGMKKIASKPESGPSAIPAIPSA